jgi:hypothetical protein
MLPFLAAPGRDACFLARKTDVYLLKVLMTMALARLAFSRLTAH